MLLRPPERNVNGDRSRNPVVPNPLTNRETNAPDGLMGCFFLKQPRSKRCGSNSRSDPLLNPVSVVMSETPQFPSWAAMSIPTASTGPLDVMPGSTLLSNDSSNSLATSVKSGFFASENCGVTLQPSEISPPLSHASSIASSGSGSASR